MAFKTWPAQMFSTIHLRFHQIANLYRQSIQGFNRTVAALTTILKTLLTIFDSQPGRIVDEVNDEIVSETSNSSGDGLIRNFQRLKSTTYREELSFQESDG